MESEKVSDLVSSASDALTSVDGIVTSIYKSHMRRYERADSYLETAILKKGFASDQDIEIAARLYAIPMLHKKYKNIAKTLSKADVLCKKRIQSTGEEVTDVNDDWLSYFIDRISIISEESIQSIFACILTQECCESGSMRKVMIDRMALLDKQGAQLFATLCQLTYSVEVSDERKYSIPLYLRNEILDALVRSETSEFTVKQAVEYQDALTCGCSESVNRFAKLESELELLQEIGLIRLSEDGDECDLYSAAPSTFCFSVDGVEVDTLSLYDKKQNVYYACTGNIVYTKMGLELYNSLKPVYHPHPGLHSLLEAYIQLQKKR